MLRDWVSPERLSSVEAEVEKMGFQEGSYSFEPVRFIVPSAFCIHIPRNVTCEVHFAPQMEKGWADRLIYLWSSTPKHFG